MGIVSAATGLDQEEANRLLEACHGEIKTAIVAQLASVSADEARRRLRASQGIVRAALDMPHESIEKGKPSIDGVATLFLAVDGGGSKTHAVVVDSYGAVRGRGSAGSSNLRAIGIEQRSYNYAQPSPRRCRPA